MATPPARQNAKSSRKRLQRQLEFYLSASNLRQDKFLREHLDEDGFLPASLFLSFNKVKQLHASEKLLLEVAAKSDVIRVDEENARIAPVDLSYEENANGEIDERTIYVEGYDVEAHDHDTLRKALAVFGKIAFISMPRFTATRRFKGFAFVEFATAAAAAYALERLLSARDEDAVLPGVRAMAKTQWLDMKNKLKAQLSCAVGEDKGIASSNAEHASSLTTAAGHVRFREEDEEQSAPRRKHHKTAASAISSPSE